MGVKQGNLSKRRAYLIDYGIIAAPEHGKGKYCGNRKTTQGLTSILEISLDN